MEAIGIDPNDQMLPKSFEVVKGETKDIWTWLLELIIDDLGGRSEYIFYILISNQKKYVLLQVFIFV